MQSAAIRQIRIDITPLIGVMIALVVVMMATTQTPTASTLIDLPPSAPCFGCGTYDEPVIVRVDDRSQLHVNGRASSLETLATDICALEHKKACTSTRIFLDGSPESAYGDFAEVVDGLRIHGFQKIGLIKKDFGES